MSTYVVQGIGYFLTHPKLWVSVICPLLLTVLVAIVTVFVLFAVALHPQAVLLMDAGVASWLAWVLSVILVIIEIFLVTLIYSLVVLPCYMDKVFAQVLTNKGFGDLVENEKAHASCLRVCASCCRVSICLRLVVLIVALPLNLIPVIGTLVYLWLNGVVLAWEYHLYYFELKGYRYSEQKAVVDERRTQYSSFGMQALFLEMIPGVGPLFLFTNTVGAALFAAKIEADLRESKAYWDNATSMPLAPTTYGTHDVAPSKSASPRGGQAKAYHAV